MAQIARLKDAEIEDGEDILAELFDAEYDQLINESNAQDTRLTAAEGSISTLESVVVKSGSDTYVDIAHTSDPSAQDGRLYYNSSQGEFRGFASGQQIAFAPPPVGSVQDYVGATEPVGWLFLDGQTIGNLASGATARANDDTQSLFELLWNSMANNEAPVSGGRGVDATTDFNAGKTINLPDLRGRVAMGKDNMGGTDAGRVTSSSTNGGNADTLGGSGGSQTHTLSTNEMPSHTHEVYYGSAGASGGNIRQVTSAPGNGSRTSSSTGGNGAHSNTQPWLALNKIIKY